MKIIIKLIFLFLSFNLYAIELDNSYKVGQYVRTISQKELVNSIRMLVYKSKPNRFFGNPGHKKIQDFLESTLSSFKGEDIEFKTQSFSLNTEKAQEFYQNDFDQKIKPLIKKDSKDYKKWESFTQYYKDIVKSKKDIAGKNFIWSKKGQSPQKIIIVAHYDTMVFDKKKLIVDQTKAMPGADFNATSVSIALSLVKILTPLKLKKSVDIVLLDAQSMAYMGAYELAASLDRTHLAGVINLEMLGHDSKVFDKTKSLRNFKVYMRSQKADPNGDDEKLFAAYSGLAQKLGANIKFQIDKNDFDKSDQFRFWELGIPAITFSQDWENDHNPRFQTGDDFTETLNQKTFYFAYQYLGLATLGYLLEIK